MRRSTVLVVVVVAVSLSVTLAAFSANYSLANDPGMAQNGGAAGLKPATFGAGCFWGVELAFQRMEGVAETAVGYMGGSKDNPTYEQVCTGKTGHAEVVHITYDPSVVPYRALVDKFFEIHDPTTLNRQKNDVGSQYRSAIFYHDDSQKADAEAGLANAQSHIRGIIVTEVTPANTFYKAEDYHQQYLEKGGQCSRKGDTTRIRCYG
eukprot:jgi/Chlat1/237/Chrsp1S03141